MQRLRLLVGRRATREETRLFVAEGRKSLAEAVAAGATVESVFVDAAAAGREDSDAVAAARDAGATVIEVQPGVLARVCDTVTPQPVAATVRAVDIGLADMARRAPLLVAVLAGIADPGNAGSILRSVAASGNGAVVLCEGSVDLYNPKTVRSSAGAVFRVPVVTGAAENEIVDQLRGLGFAVMATDAGGGQAYTEADLGRRVAIVLGNEANGLPASLAEAADSTLRIPMAEGSESLGVAAAGAVLFFEAARQRHLGAGTMPAPGSSTAGTREVAGAA